MAREYNYDNQPQENKPSKQKMSYQKAKELRKKSLSDLLTSELLGEGSTVGGSLKKAISTKTKSTMTGLKEKFDPLNIVKFMTFGSKLAPAMLGKMTGRSDEDMKYFAGESTAKPVGDKTTKVGQLEGGDEGFITVLSQIYSLLKKSHEDQITDTEKRNNFLEEKKMEDDARHKKLLAALGVKVESPQQTATKEPEQQDPVGSVADDILMAFGGMQMIKTIGTWFLTGAGATLLTVVAAGALGGWLGEKFKEWKDSRAQDMGGSKAAAALTKMKGIDDADSEAYKQAETEYNAAIKEKQEFVRQYLEQNGYKTYLKTNLFGKETGQYYYEKPNGKGPTDDELKLASAYADDKLATAQKVETASTPGTSATSTPGATGSTGTPGTTGATGAPGTPGSTATPGTTTSSSETGATPTPAPSTPTAAPVATTPASDVVNTASMDNAGLKLQESLGALATEVVNNTKNVVKTMTSGDMPKFPIPPVRNMEQSYQRMIMNSTRIV